MPPNILFIHSMNRIVLTTGSTEVNEIDKVPAFMELISGEVGGEK